ncbi:CAP domain-containing protein [Phyllosticta citribraziliensis]|uniref:CAP domain-containing protein n=1 Tax=Phyllosticta citribraziliensis TaxID=989973 RepID=A0ABR1LSV6_9PEZI
MRSSVLLSAAFAANALAVPARLDKRVYVTDLEFVTVTQLVTEGVELPAITSTITLSEAPVETFPVQVSTFAPPPPPPATTETPIIVVPTTTPTPTSTQAPTTESPPPAPTTTSSSSPSVNVANIPTPTTTPSKTGGFNYQPLCATPDAQSGSQLTTTPNTDAAKKWLAYHNAHRTNHTTCSMYWDYSLEAEAKKAADTCVYAHTKSDGQNMAEYTVYGTQLTADNMTTAAGTFSNMYYSEGQYFNGFYGLATPTTSQDTGHFTQMIWKDSYAVGCATTQCNSMLLSFCNYYPGGNILTTYALNVLDLITSPLPPLCAESGDAPGCISDASLGL